MSTLSASQFQDQMIGVVVTLVRIYEASGLSEQEAKNEVSKFLQDVAKTLITIDTTQERPDNV